MKIEVQSLEYSLLQLPRNNTIIIISPSALDTMDTESKKLLDNSRCIYTNEVDYHSVLKMIDDKIVTVVSIGDDTAINLSSFIAENKKLYHIIIPSSFATNNFIKVKPNEVRLDYGYIKKSYDENLSGIVELLSINTLLKDWRLYQAHLVSNHNYNDVIDDTYHTAINCFNSALELSVDIINSGEIDLHKLFEIIYNSGELSYHFGCVKLYSRHLDVKFSNLIGMYIMEYFYRMNSYILNGWSLTDFNKIHVICKKLGLIDKFNELKVPYDTLYNTLKNLKPYGYYSLVDKLPELYDIVTATDINTGEIDETDYDYILLAEFLNSKKIKTF